MERKKKHTPVTPKGSADIKTYIHEDCMKQGSDFAICLSCFPHAGKKATSVKLPFRAKRRDRIKYRGKGNVEGRQLGIRKRLPLPK